MNFEIKILVWQVKGAEHGRQRLLLSCCTIKLQKSGFNHRFRVRWLSVGLGGLSNRIEKDVFDNLSPQGKRNVQVNKEQSFQPKLVKIAKLFILYKEKDLNKMQRQSPVTLDHEPAQQLSSHCHE